MDYRAIARAITDIENQPHQWSNQNLAEFFVSAADEIERLREALQSIKKIPNSEAAYGIIQTFVDDALKEKE